MNSPLSYMLPTKPKDSNLTVTDQNADAHSTDATTQKNENWTLKEKLVYGFLTAVGVGGTIWIGKKVIRNLQSNKEENKSFEEGSSATVAKQIKMAFENDGWPGTNTEALRGYIIAIPSKEEWDKVLTSYHKLYGNNLLKDMSDELQTTEYNEMLQIVGAKPLKKGQAPSPLQYSAWAKRLKAAFDKVYGFLPGTDSASVTITLKEIPTQSAFVRTGVAYKKLYGTNLMDDLKSEGEFGQSTEWLKIIVQKKKN